MTVTVIVGLGGSGKSTLAKELKDNFGYDKVIHNDQLIYYPGTWNTRDYDDFRNYVFKQVDNSNDNIIYEGLYYHRNDPEHKRLRVMIELFQVADNIIFIKPDTKKEISARLIDRSINRVLGNEVSESTEETSESRAGLMISAIEGYDANASHHDDARIYAETIVNCNVILSLYYLSFHHSRFSDFLASSIFILSGLAPLATGSSWHLFFPSSYFSHSFYLTYSSNNNLSD